MDLFEQTLNAWVTPMMGVELLQLGPQPAQRLCVVYEACVLLQKHVQPEPVRMRIPQPHGEQRLCGETRDAVSWRREARNKDGRRAARVEAMESVPTQPNRRLTEYTVGQPMGKQARTPPRSCLCPVRRSTRHLVILDGFDGTERARRPLPASRSPVREEHRMQGLSLEAPAPPRRAWRTDDGSLFASSSNASTLAKSSTSRWVRGLLTHMVRRGRHGATRPPAAESSARQKRTRKRARQWDRGAMLDLTRPARGWAALAGLEAAS